ncbi:hypothetical protein [Thiohalorhabdus methylotrophus]|uniref:Outer membrane protein beta-barrel domain-containing protein n=1 Tax=Thiohalorhabdus methylotrophus TaxID=3242694 RepID=A0ABV4TUN8_9GAMM
MTRASGPAFFFPLLAAACLLLPQAAVAQARGGGAIVHTAALVGYDVWIGQSSELSDRRWGYGATFKYFGGSAETSRLGIGVTWMHNTLKVSSPYSADGRTFDEDLDLDRVGVDLYYGLPANTRNEVPYFLAGGGQLTAEGGTVNGDTESVSENFWEVGMGIINGGSRYTSFALELKYIGKMGSEIREDDGIIELSMSIGYNW